MARRKKNKTANQIKYEKQVKRIKNFIRRAEKRGFRFDKEEILPSKKPKRITKKILQKLESLNPKKLYEKATAISETTGKVISGIERRREERREAALKGLKNKRRIGTGVPPRKEDIIWYRLNDLIKQFPDKGARYLEKVLEGDIKKYGKNSVLKAISMAPDEILSAAQELAYYDYEDPSAASSAIRNLAEIIKGNIMSYDESIELANVLDEV